MTGERWRLFVGIFPPAELAEELGSRIESWKRQLGPGLAWVRPEKLHLTLCFLGNVEKERVDVLVRTLKEVQFEPFELQLRGLGCFPDVRRPKVFWAGIQGEMERLWKLQMDVAKLCEQFQERHERNRFSPHLTLARVKGGIPILGRIPKADSDCVLGGCEILEFTLMRSVLGLSATYEAVAKFSSEK